MRLMRSIVVLLFVFAGCGLCQDDAVETVTAISDFDNSVSSSLNPELVSAIETNDETLTTIPENDEVTTISAANEETSIVTDVEQSTTDAAEGTEVLSDVTADASATDLPEATSLVDIEPPKQDAVEGEAVLSNLTTDVRTIDVKDTTEATLQETPSSSENSSVETLNAVLTSEASTDVSDVSVTDTIESTTDLGTNTTTLSEIPADTAETTSKSSLDTSDDSTASVVSVCEPNDGSCSTTDVSLLETTSNTDVVCQDSDACALPTEAAIVDVSTEAVTTVEPDVIESPYISGGLVEYQVGHTRIRGERMLKDNLELHVFRGVPYAHPPGGPLRFTAPVEYKLPNGTYNATVFGPACPQRKSFLPLFTNITSEDCLYLNIWVSRKVEQEFYATRKLAPVVVLIHGGAFSFGAGSEPYMDGSALAERGVVAVSINYRLGVFGFLDFYSTRAPGNMGLLDQLTALKWINRNIDKFYGNPRSVTLVGVSAGSYAISAHLVHEESRYYFNRAVLDAGTLMCNFTESFKTSLAKGLEISRILGCPDSEYAINDVLDCLSYKTTDELVEAETQIADDEFLFLPTYGSYFLPQTPDKMIERISKNKNIPILLGTSMDEGTLFVSIALSNNTEPPVVEDFFAIVRSFSRLQPFHNESNLLDSVYSSATPTDNAFDYVGDGLITCGTIDFANRMSRVGSNVTMYLFSYNSTGRYLPAWLKIHHAMSFGYLIGLPVGTMSNMFTKARDKNVAKYMVNMVTRFASGDSVDGGAPLQYNGTDLVGYNVTSSRVVNQISTTGHLEFIKPHPREKACYRLWISPDAVPEDALSDDNEDEVTTTDATFTETVSTVQAIENASSVDGNDSVTLLSNQDTEYITSVSAAQEISVDTMPTSSEIDTSTSSDHESSSTFTSETASSGSSQTDLTELPHETIPLETTVIEILPQVVEEPATTPETTGEDTSGDSSVSPAYTEETSISTAFGSDETPTSVQQAENIEVTQTDVEQSVSQGEAANQETTKTPTAAQTADIDSSDVSSPDTIEVVTLA